MNFLNAVKNGNTTQFYTTKPESKSKPSLDKDVSIDENYINNVKDSEIICRSEELTNICEEFIADTLLFDNPLLMKHHLGYKNFVIEMLNIFQNNISVVINEKDEQETDIDEELDVSDLSDLYYYDQDSRI